MPPRPVDPGPGKVVDARFIELQIGDGRLGPTDFKFFARIDIDPEEIGRWRNILKPGTASASPEFTSPGPPASWWLGESGFDKAALFQPKELFGRINGWVIFDPDSTCLWVYTFTL